MTSYAFSPPQIVSLPIFESHERFPVRRVYCVGRNYAAHAIEMGHDPNKEPPFFFQKNADNLDTSGNFPYPKNSVSVHFEAEIAVTLKAGGTNISMENAHQTIFGYALAIDMTRRDLQAEQKRLGRPWEIGKAFERSAPIGPVFRVETIGKIDNESLCLKLNGKIKQKGNVSQMIWKIPELICNLSNYFKLDAGDVILTGTPSGVGPLQKDDTLEVLSDQLGQLTVKVI